jgi:hypothetical protein
MKVARGEGAPSGSQYRVFGEVTNADQVNATKVRLTVTTYDADKRVVGYRDLILSDGPLAPGTNLPFDVTLASSTPNVTSFAVVVEALKAQ